MRTFEILLILINFLTLFMSFKNQSKRIRLGVAGVNLSLFIIHSIFEGLRYQMIFSYIFVIAFVVYTLVKIKEKYFETKTPKALKVMAIGLSFVFLVTSSFLSYALPVFKLPKPTGSYDVGLEYVHLVDENRNEPFLDKSTKKRELMVKVYYPANEDNSKPYSAYFHNSPQLIKAFTAGYSMPDFIFSHLNLVKTNSKEDLKISDKEKSYPVVLFSHGAGTTMEVQTSQCEDLASNGYIVVAIDHTYVSWATEFPHRIVSGKEATTDFKTDEPVEIITQIMADDSKFVIESLNEGKLESLFKGKLNLDKIGAIGHSVGGAVAYDLALNDSRIKVAVNLDGVVYITPKDDSRDMAPFLMIANDEYHIQGIENKEPLMKKFEDMNTDDQKITLSMYGSEEKYNQSYNKARKNITELGKILKESGNIFTIDGSSHMKFIDIGYFIGVEKLRELIGIGGKTDPQKCLDITKSVTLTFLDQNLKGETKDSINSLIKKYPELKKVDLK